MTLTLTSPAFADGEAIPRKYTRDGENLCPPIRWTGAPDGVRSYVLLVEDPDAPSGTFRHCAITNIPADAEELPQSVDTAPDWPFLKYARNDFGNADYDGPEPPRATARTTISFVWWHSASRASSCPHRPESRCCGRRRENT